MYLHLKNDKPLGFAYVQVKLLQLVPDRILFPFTLIRLQLEKTNLSNSDIKTDRIFLEQPKPDSHGYRNTNANDPTFKMVLHVCAKSTSLAD